ncbi:MAG: four helix bundle protein [Desulfohalobiaceae bacterium]
MFGHERLDVYQLALKYVAWVHSISERLKGQHRYTRDQWIRSSESVPQNIAEGNGKGTVADRRRYFEIARGSSLECAASQDILQVTNGLTSAENLEGKEMLERIVSMLTKMSMREYQSNEEPGDYSADNNDEER